MKALNLLAVITLLLQLSACTPNHTTAKQLLDFGSFRLTTPSGWQKIPKRGIDRYVGALSNGLDTLWFEYGIYNVNLDIDESYNTVCAKDTINGYTATLIKCSASGKVSLGMQIMGIEKTRQFTIWGDHIQDENTVIYIYKSLMLPGSDSLKNPPLTAGKFSGGVYKSPYSLFNHNCASCHSVKNKRVGPALRDVIPLRNAAWVYTFLTKRKDIIKDSLQLHMEKEYEIRCYEFKELTEEEVERLYSYIVQWQHAYF